MLYLTWSCTQQMVTRCLMNSASSIGCIFVTYLCTLFLREKRLKAREPLSVFLNISWFLIVSHLLMGSRWLTFSHCLYFTYGFSLTHVFLVVSHLLMVSSWLTLCYCFSFTYGFSLTQVSSLFLIYLWFLIDSRFLIVSHLLMDTSSVILNFILPN